MKCAAKHTKPQPEGPDFACPKCGTTPSNSPVHEFFIQDIDEDADSGCELLHERDTVGCSKCDYGASGKALARAVAKAKCLVTCPTCKGKGLVDGGAA